MLSGAASDQIALADQLAVEFTTGAYAADAIGMLDALLVSKDFVGPDAVAATDTARTATAFHRMASDAVAADDAVYLGGAALQGETILGGIVVGSAYAYTVSPDGPVSASGGEDCVTAPIGFIIQHGDYLHVVDLPVIEWLFLVASDAIAAIDGGVVNMDYSRRAQDALALAESVIRAVDTNRILVDVVSLIDAVGLQRYVELSDAATLGESLRLESTFQVWIENLEPVSVSDSRALEYQAHRTQDDSASALDQVQISQHAGREMSDQVSLSESTEVESGTGGTNVIAGAFNVVAGAFEVVAA
jgi:hypothetical protein